LRQFWSGFIGAERDDDAAAVLRHRATRKLRSSNAWRSTYVSIPQPQLRPLDKRRLLGSNGSTKAIY
jgi:hypothetical protein